MRRVHGSVAVGMIYGQVAMLLAATKPSALKRFLGTSAWVAETPSTRWLLLIERLADAALALDDTILGSDEDAEDTARRVRRAHASVKVNTPMMVWVLTCIALAEEEVYGMLVRPLGAIEGERYWADWRGFGDC